jgi:hypothetical protein
MLQIIATSQAFAYSTVNKILRKSSLSKSTDFDPLSIGANPRPSILTSFHHPFIILNSSARHSSQANCLKNRRFKCFRKCKFYPGKKNS